MKNTSQKLVCGPSVSVYELLIFARLVSLSHPKQRSVSTSTLSQTSRTSPKMPWIPWVRSLDNVLSSWPYQLSNCCNFWSYWARKMEGAEPSPPCTQHTVSPCAWYQHKSVNGMPSLQVCGTLRSRAIQRSEQAHVARAAGIELAHSEGQYVIHFPWGVRKFCDSIKAHLLIPQLVARGDPLETLVLGSLTHKSPRCLQVGNGYSDITSGCASSVLAGCLQSCSWARGLLFELVQALGYVVPGAVYKEHIDDLSQFVTNMSRIQLFQDAALVGKAVKEGTVKLGLTLSGKSTLLANDKSLGKLIVGHFGDEGVPICLGTSATDLGIETAAVKSRCAANQWKRIWKGRRRAKRVNRLCKTNSEAQKTHDDGHTPCSNLRPHRARSVHRTGQCDVQKPSKWAR